MNKTLAVVQAWADYEEINPDGTLADFCKNYLENQRLTELSAVGSSCDEEAACRFDLSRTIVRLSKLWMYFTLQAMKPMAIQSFDEFLFLFTVSRIPDIRKKDLIYTHFIEMSSGILIIDRLLKKGFLEEKGHELDKRSKILKLTKPGEQTLMACHEQLENVQQAIYGSLPISDTMFCLEKLAPIERSIGQRWNKLKNFEPVK